MKAKVRKRTRWHATHFRSHVASDTP